MLRLVPERYSPQAGSVHEGVFTSFDPRPNQQADPAVSTRPVQPLLLRRIVAEWVPDTCFTTARSPRLTFRAPRLLLLEHTTPRVTSSGYRRILPASATLFG